MNENCERCDEALKPGKEVWLELDSSAGRYVRPGVLPEGHESQGEFPFGAACARKELQAP